RGLEAAGELSQLHVLRDVDQHRTGPAGRSDVERLCHCLGDVVDVLDQVVVLGDGGGDAVDVRLLEGVGADEAAGHVACNGNDRRRVHLGGRESGYQVGGTRATGGEADARLAAGAVVGI